VGCPVQGASDVGPPASAGPDFLVAGTIWASESHPGEPGRGPERVAEVVAAAAAAVAGGAAGMAGGPGGAGARAPAPVLGIGGVTPERVAAVRVAGGWGVAVLGGVWRAADPVAAAARYLDALEGAP
jgi:thiamine monophosphate synthase